MGVKAVSSGEPVRKELKTLPGGFVVIAKQQFGQKLDQLQMSSKLAIQATKGRKNDSVQGEMQLANKRATELQFAELIVDHNLEDDDGRPLNFKNPSDVHKLDARVGAEIEAYIEELINFDEYLENLL